MPAPPSSGLDHRTLEKYESIWAGLSLVLVVLLFVGVLASMISGTFPLLRGGGHGAAPASGRIDPTKLGVTAFAHPGLVRTDSGLELYIVARAFTFTPAVVRVPAGTPITLHVTSADVVHGFQVTGTTLNDEILPGHVSSFTVTFRQSGEQHVICNEYCGAGHQDMITRFIVEAPKKE
ncbi:cytochrome C oxidase subunit II [Deinococcus sp. KSM4-11]|uniref:cytochrome c oxidase subunit II n=1 Tax=Deinococcus sp. KSM4-11 TaxID=2568654 RepID=UPI0010A52F1A|nr:cytochrome c oxidase subunit II [Deinococcus sp. KSM4-11]THF86483.1 cytochrome C oxidase subunit II [Deinococcus sp. KSM4-11]